MLKRNRTAILLITAMLMALSGPIMAVASSDGTGNNAIINDLLEQGPKVADYAQLPAIPLGSQNYFTLDRAFIFQGEQGKMAAITISLHNGGKQELKPANYWVKIESQTGVRYNAQMIADDISKGIVVPQSKEQFTYLAHVNNNTRLQDLVITVFEWDYGYTDFEKDLGKFVIPANYDSVTPASLSREIYIASESFLTTVSEPQFLLGAESQIVSFSVQLKNTSPRRTLLPNLKFIAMSSDGYVYSLEADGLSNLHIQPQAKRTLLVSGTIPLGVDTHGLTVYALVADSATKSDYPVAAYNLPGLGESGEWLTPSGVVRRVEIAGQPVNTWIDRVSITENIEKQQVHLYYNWENTSIAPIAIPDYGFMILTQDGSMYPMEHPKIEGLTVRPKDKQQIQLSTSIPRNVSTENLRLIVYKSNPQGIDKNLIFPSAAYSVQQNSWSGLETTATFTNSFGTYRMKVNGLQRLPWDDKDQLTVELTVENESEVSLPLPDLSAYLRLDGVAQVDAKVVKMDEDILLSSYGTIHYMVLAHVPYESVFKEVSLVFQEKEDQDLTNLAQFRLPSTAAALPVIAVGRSHDFLDSGKSANVAIQSIRSYQSEYATNDLYFVELKVKNIEKRFNELTQWVGYFKTNDDVYFPANVSNFKQKVAPGGEVLLSFWSKLPRGYDWNQLQILLGQAVAGNKLATSGSSADSFVRAALFNIPEEDNPKIHFKDLEIGPYTISLSEINASLATRDIIRFTFDYEVEKDTRYETSLEGHQFVVEFTNGDITFTEELNIEVGTSGKVLQLGTGTYQFQKPQPSIYLRIPMLEEFTLRLYDQFEGQRHLLVERDLPWFVSSEID